MFARRIRSTVLVAVVITACAVSRSGHRAGAPSRTTSELEHATKEIYDALPKGDRAVWDRWLADDFVLLDRDGKTQDRAAVLVDIKPLPPGIVLGFTYDELIVRELGRDAAMVAFMVHETETIFGQTLHVDYRTALTFARRNGRWQLVVFQYVEVPRDARAVAIAPDRLAAYVGTYAADAATRYRVTLRDGKLRGRRGTGDEVELVPEADGVFYVPGTEFRKIFVRDPRGQIVEMLDRRKGTDVRWRKLGEGTGAPSAPDREAGTGASTAPQRTAPALRSAAPTVPG